MVMVDKEVILKEARRLPMAEALGKIPTAELIPALMSLFADARATQETLLLEIVDRCKDTEFGRAHDFAAIRTAEDFRRRVPVSKYDAFLPYIEKIKNGARDVLTEGAPDYMLISAGTTGDFKYLPESHENFRAKQNHFRARFQRWWECGLFGRGTTHLALSSNTPVLTKTKGGLDCGSASGMSYRMMDPKIFGDETAAASAYPAAIRGCGGAEAVDYLIMRFAIENREVSNAGGNNGGRLRLLLNTADANAEELLKDIENGTISDLFEITDSVREQLASLVRPNPERAAELREALAAGGGRFKPKFVWPKFRGLIVWISGLMAAHIEDLAPDMPDGAIFLDAGYGASEIDINFPMTPGDGFGPLCIHEAFFEFMPLGGGEPFLAHEVPDGKYRLILTTYGGLYRYDLEDIVEVRGRTGDTPMIRFVSKDRDLLNLFGEHILASRLAEIMHAAAAGLGAPLRQTGIWADLSGCRYVCCVEPQNDDFPLEEFERQIEEDFKNGEAAYEYARGGMHFITSPVKVLQMKQGWQSELYRRKIRPGLSEANIKLQIAMKEAPEEEWILHGRA